MNAGRGSAGRVASILEDYFRLAFSAGTGTLTSVAAETASRVAPIGRVMKSVASPL
jgi:hypothetical protein